MFKTHYFLCCKPPGLRLSMSRLEDDAKKDHVLSQSFKLLRHGVSTGDESGPSALAVPPPESLAQETKRLKLQETLGGCNGRGCCWVCSFWWGDGQLQNVTRTAPALD